MRQPDEAILQSGPTPSLLCYAVERVACNNEFSLLNYYTLINIIIYIIYNNVLFVNLIGFLGI